MRFGQWFSRDSQDVAFVLLLQAQLSVLHVLGFFFCLFLFFTFLVSPPGPVSWHLPTRAPLGRRASD